MYILFIISGSAAQRGLWPPRSRGFVITHNDATQSVGLLWTSVQLVVETSTWHTTHTTDEHPCPRWDFFFCPILFVSCILFVWYCSGIRRKTERMRAVDFSGAVDFSILKDPLLRLGANPRSWVPEASTQTLDHRSRSDSNTQLQQARGRRPTP
jgi:hypothetical protein